MADQQGQAKQPQPKQPPDKGSQQAPQHGAPRAAVRMSGGTLRLRVQQSTGDQGGVGIWLGINDGQGNQLVSWNFDGQDANFAIEIPFQDLNLGVQPTE